MKPAAFLSAARLSLPLATALAALLAAPSVHAGQIWDGSSIGPGDDNWNTPANWDSDSLPTFTNAITFTGNTRNGAVNDLTADSIIGGTNLTNDGTSGKTNAFTLSGARITLGGDITTTASSSAITDSISLAMILDGNRAITTNTNHSLIIGGIISETGGARDLTKNGPGTLRFDSINTYSGTSTINAGAVEVRAGTAGGSAVWGGGPITLNQGASLYFNPTAQAIQNTGGFTVSGPITLSGGAGTSTLRFAGNDNKFPLGGGVTGQAGVAQTLAITQGASGGAGDRQDILFTGAIANGSGGTLGVSVDFAGSSGSAQSAFVNLRGQNTFTGNLTVTNSKGMNAGGSYPGAWLTIGGERYNGFIVPTTATVGNGYLGAGADYSGNISISNGSGGLTTLSFLTTANQILRGVISGTGSLNKAGGGTLTLTNTNTFSGTTTISTGTLIMGNALALQNSPLGTTSTASSLTLFGSPTTLQIGGLSGTTGSLGTIVSSSAYNSISALTLNPQAGVSVTYGGVLANGAAGMTLTKTGAGTQILSGANTFSGVTTVSAGTLTLDYATQNNSKLSDSAALILGGGTITLSGGSHTEVVASTTLQAGTISSITRSSIDSVLQLGTVTVNTGALLNLGAAGIATTNNTNNSLGILGSWATITGTGWAVNSTNGANGSITGASYTDVTRLSSGTKTIASDSANYRIVEGTGTVGDVTMAAAGTTSINTLVNNATTAGTVDIGTGNTLSTGAILQGTGAGALTIGVSGATAGTLGALSAGGDLGILVNSTNGVTINSVIADNSASTLTKDGTGTLTLNSANTYTGGTTVNAGTMVYASKNSFGTGTVTLAGGTTMRKITEEANSAGLAMTNNINLSGGQVTMNMDFTAAKDQWFSGIISGPGSLRATGSGNFSRGLQLAGNNTFSGGVTLDTSTASSTWIALVHANGLGTGTLTINHTAGVANQGLGAISNLTSGSGVANNIVINSGATLNLGGTSPAAAGNVLLSGVISGSGNLNKSDVPAKTFTLAGANTYTGNTTVSTGTLVLADNAQLMFVLGAISGSNNSISGAGTVTLEGDFVIDTSAADALPSGTWTLENVSSLAGAYGANFSVFGFTDAGSNKWTKPNGAKLYTFDETTGILTLAPTPGYSSWASLNGAGPNLNDDHDNDGVDNGTEYFLGGPNGNTTGFTALPGVDSNLGILSVTWIKGAGYIGNYNTDFVVETSITLSGTWTVEASPGNVADSPTSVTYTFPGGPAYSGKRFARLKVTGP